jgi:hypothetical protein
MSRKLTSLLVSSALVLSMTTTAWAQTVSNPPATTELVQSTAVSAEPSSTPPVAKAEKAGNQPPLAPGGAAGIDEIRQAQGLSPLGWWIVGGLVAGALLWWILDDDDDSSSDTSPSY